MNYSRNGTRFQFGIWACFKEVRYPVLKHAQPWDLHWQEEPARLRGDPGRVW